MLDNYKPRTLFLEIGLMYQSPLSITTLPYLFIWGTPCSYLFNPIQLTDSCLVEGTSDAGTFGIYGSVQALRKKAIPLQWYSLYYKANFQTLEEKEGKLHFLHYVNVSESIQ